MSVYDDEDDYGYEDDAPTQNAKSISAEANKDHEWEDYDAEPEKAVSANQLKDQEQNPDGHGSSALDDARERLGLGYTGDPDKMPRDQRTLNTMFKSNSRARRRIAIATAFGGASFAGAIAAFLLMLPLKLEHIMTNLDSTYGAATQQALDEGTDKMVSQYFAKYVLPSLRAGTCGSTIDRNCVRSVPGKNNPIQKAFRAFKEQGIERRLAEQGIVLGKKKNDFYINFSGQVAGLKNQDVTDVIDGNKSLFDMDFGTEKVSRKEFRLATREAVKDMTKRDQIYMRFKLGAFLEAKYGLKRCWVACNLRDDAADKLDSPKKVSRYFVANYTQRVISSMSEEMGIVIGCVLSPDSGCGTDKPGADGDTVSEEGATRETKYRREMSSRLASYRSKYGSESLDTLLKQVDEIEKNGSVSKYVTTYALKKVFGDVVADRVVGLSNPVSLIYSGAKLINQFDSVKDIAKKMAYAVKIGTVAIPTYMAMRSFSDEIHHGGVPDKDSEYTFDAAAVGSTMEAFSNSGIDATESPLYGSLMGTETKKTASSGLLGGVAYAASKSVGGGYKCTDGKGVPEGSQVCNEEKVGSASPAINNLFAVVESVPGWGAVTTVAHFVADNPISDILNWVNDKTGAVIEAIPGVGKLSEVAAKLVQPLMDIISSKIIENILVDGSNSGASDTTTAAASSGGLVATAYAADPLSSVTDTKVLPSGARMFNIVAMGADASFNEDCQAQLGCKAVSDSTAAAIRDEYLAEKKAGFQSQSFFARMFDTSSPYSMVSKVALAAPSSLDSASSNLANNIASLNLAAIPSALGSLFSSNRAYAAPTADAFGIQQNAFPTADIEALGDFDTFYTNNCEGEKFASYTQKWLDDMVFDENTGTTKATRTNGCLYLQTVAQTNAGSMDKSLLPESLQTAGTPTSTEAPTGSVNVGSFNICHSHDYKCPDTASRLELSSNIIKKNHLDIVGLQEARPDQQQVILNDRYLGSGYSIWPEDTKGAGFSPNAVVYDNTKFTADKKASKLRSIEYTLGKPTNDLVELHLNAEGGGKVIFLSTHDPANVRCTKPGGVKAVCEQSRKDNARTYVDLINTLHDENPGVPIFLVGDFNSPYVGDPSWPSCIIEKSPVVDDAWAIYKHKTDDECLKNRPLGSQIDRIYASEDVKVSNFWIAEKGFGPAGNGSDHHDTIMATVQFSGIAGESPTVAGDSTVPALRNFRDASTTSGSSVLKSSVLYRSDQLNHLTTKGEAALLDLLTNKGTIIDVRTKEQRAADPDPGIAGVNNVSIPIDGLTDLEGMVTSGPGGNKKNYERMKQVSRVLSTAANADGPVLIHCMSGKDRTGWIVALIMYANGATDSQVMTEYLKSNDAKNNGHVEAAWLNSGLSAVKKDFGSIEHYIKDSNGLNLSKSDYDNLVKKF